MAEFAQLEPVFQQLGGEERMATFVVQDADAGGEAFPLRRMLAPHAVRPVMGLKPPRGLDL